MMRTNPFPAARPKAAFSLVELLCVLGIIGVLVALILPAVQYARESANRTACSNNLKQIGVALSSYETAHGLLPPAKINPGGYRPVPGDAGSPVLGGGTKNTTGWTLLLSHLEASSIAESYNFDLCSSANAAASGSLMPVAGSDVANSTAVGSLLGCFLCPTNPRPFPTTYLPDTPSEPYSMRNGMRASYRFAVATAGEGRLYSVASEEPDAGPFGTNGGARFADVRDGLSNTMLVGEVRHPNDSSPTAGGAWWGAGVVDCCHGVVAPGQRFGSFSSPHSSGIHACFGDGSVRFLASDVSADLFFRMQTIHGDKGADGL